MFYSNEEAADLLNKFYTDSNISTNSKLPDKDVILGYLNNMETICFLYFIPEEDIDVDNSYKGTYANSEGIPTTLKSYKLTLYKFGLYPICKDIWSDDKSLYWIFNDAKLTKIYQDEVMKGYIEYLTRLPSEKLLGNSGTDKLIKSYKEHLNRAL